MNMGHDILERFHVVVAEMGDFEAANELAALIANGLEPSQSGKLPICGLMVVIQKGRAR